ncbi:MAG: DUF6198 family protein [Lachnospiraceae bacterium]|nr:DUF6198 family protein [Lachnospiraceae bacterium]
MNNKWFENAKSELGKKYNFINWFLGNLFVGLGVCLATKSDFGLSMIAAPPYILHVWLRDSFPFFTQGTAEYVFEAIVLIITCIIVRKFRLRYLLSFGEAVVAGLFIDGWFLVFGGNGAYTSMTLRIIALILGLIMVALGVAFFFRTTLPLQTYELSVVEIARAYNLEQHRVKQVFDAVLLAVSLILSFALTGKLTGIGISTVLAVLVNARIIQFTGRIIDKLEK